MVFFVKSVKHTFYTLHTIIPDFGDVRKLTGYSPFTDMLIRDTKSKGITAISLEATDMGRPLYEKYGFVKMNGEMELPER